MADVQPFAGLASENTVSEMSGLTDQVRALNDTMLYFITAMLDKLPLLDANDRAQVRLGAIDAALTLATVTSVGTVTTVGSVTASTLTNMAGGNTSLMPYQSMPTYIYDNIKVS